MLTSLSIFQTAFAAFRKWFPSDDTFDPFDTGLADCMMANDFATLQSAVSSALVSTTRSASALANEDLPFHRSLDASLGTKLDRQNARLLGLASGLLGVARPASETVRRPPSLRDVEGIENNWRAVVDVVDSLLERADTALDEFTGAVKRMSPAADGQNVPNKPAKISKIAQQLKAMDMEKPQLHFEHVPTNDEVEPFKPLLKSKPHALIALQAQPVSANGSTASHYSHPYQQEIENYQYPATIYTSTTPTPYHPFDSTTATFVETEEMLHEMLDELKQAKEIAIDLEHHDQRSYIGIVSLMQISTRDRDWIVDTLKPWRRKLHVLNEVFADPNIIKILHGAYMDIVWLQRDLGLYLVGLFDTHYAARALGYPGGSLAFLLKKFANVDAQKQYQMADWRIRPLPQELFDYARSDTHYLLYIFDCMRNELIQRSNLMLPNHEGDKLWHVLQKSNETALQRYEHPIYDFELGLGTSGWYKMISRTPALFTREQFAVFRAVHKWRDGVAREQDDSTHYVMPNHQVFSLAREMPTNRAAVLGLAQPTTQTVRLRTDELVNVIITAKEAGKNGPEMVDVLNKIEPLVKPMRSAKGTTQVDSVASYLPKNTENTPTVNGLATLPLRSTTSTFWGEAFDSSAHIEDSQSHPHSFLPDDIDLKIPLPALTAEVFTDSLGEPSSATPAQSQPVSQPESAPVADEDDEVFVLKEMNRKRKRAGNTPAEQGDGVAAQSDEVAIDDDEIERQREKQARRKAKKEAKRAAKRAAAGTEEDVNGEAAEEEPFDYNAAPSMLNPPKESREEMRARKKKEVNPYAKALDTPKGLPRSQKERAGRSMTYQ